MSVLFGGIDDFFNILALSDIFVAGAGDFAVVVTLKPVIGANITILAKDDLSTRRQFSVLIRPDGAAQIVYFKAGGVQVRGRASDGLLSNNVWTTLLLQKRSGVFEIYKDGPPLTVALSGTHGSMQTVDLVTRIGTFSNGALSFNGQIAEVSYHLRSFDANEAFTLTRSRIIKMAAQIDADNRVVHYPLNDQPDGQSADGTTAKDISGNGVDAIGDNGANNTGLTWRASQYLSYIHSVQRVISPEVTAVEIVLIVASLLLVQKRAKNFFTGKRSGITTIKKRSNISFEKVG